MIICLLCKANSIFYESNLRRIKIFRVPVQNIFVEIGRDNLEEMSLKQKKKPTKNCILFLETDVFWAIGISQFDHVTHASFIVNYCLHLFKINFLIIRDEHHLACFDNAPKTDCEKLQ